MLTDIEFKVDWFAEVQDKDAPGRLRQVAYRKGTRLRAEVRSVEGENGPVANLRLMDGSTALGIPLSGLSLVDLKSHAA